ncbi:TraR/DksA family transcriptional regulator [Portibacter lacus]|uniref:DksA/traR C4-type zinc finger family protein n=1 Tax=Portibacter lacus TaxID=1099794 RepID=A0AA37WF85_9BACT|nr:TraR/DksA family transcriptional regulator [Portibacter lacus]GLR18568.1 dksA/traR C4-type zinc finger family protein [Portibacter lacus]
MEQKEKLLLKSKIIAMVEKAQLDIINMENNTQPVKPENSLGRISRMDAINNKSVMEASLRNTRKKLAKLKTALSNIDNENFGICTYCKNEIQPKRLMYMPESDQCVRCAARH